jgi:hypothetical protein
MADRSGQRATAGGPGRQPDEEASTMTVEASFIRELFLARASRILVPA